MFRAAFRPPAAANALHRRSVQRMGMASSPELLKELSKCSSQAVVDALWVMGYPQNMIEGARPLAPGMQRRQKEKYVF